MCHHRSSTLPERLLEDEYEEDDEHDREDEPELEADEQEIRRDERHVPFIPPADD